MAHHPSAGCSTGSPLRAKGHHSGLPALDPNHNLTVDCPHHLNPYQAPPHLPLDRRLSGVPLDPLTTPTRTRDPSSTRHSSRFLRDRGLRGLEARQEPLSIGLHQHVATAVRQWILSPRVGRYPVVNVAWEVEEEGRVRFLV